MRIPTGINMSLGRWSMMIQLDMPQGPIYDFHIFDINLHECDGDVALNFVLVGFRLRLGRIKNEEWENIKLHRKLHKDDLL